MRALLRVWHFMPSVLLVGRVGCSPGGLSAAKAVAEIVTIWQELNGR